MIRARSILSRLMAPHALATLVTALVVAASVWWLLDTTSQRLQRQTLGAYADRLQAGLRLDRPGVHGVDDEARTALRGGGDSFSFGVLDEGRLAPVQGLAAPPPLRGLPAHGPSAFFQRVQGSKLYWGLSVPVAERPGLRIVVIQNLDHPDIIFDDVSAQVLVIGALLILVLLAAQMATHVWIVRRTLAPVRKASQAVQAVGAHALDARIDVAPLPTEVAPLGAAFNKALDRVTQAYRIERDFAADAAHELRTPLSVLQLRAEQVADGVLRGRLLAQIGQVRDIVERLLLIAEIDAHAPDASARTDLRELAEEQVAAIAPLALGKGQALALSGARRAMVAGEGAQLGRALAALLENAVRHTPPGTSITVSVDAGAVHVGDDGPGIGDIDPAELFRRFRRGGDRQDHAGSGLGLSIAMTIMRRIGGDVVVSRGQRGVVFSLVFPEQASARAAEQRAP